ncbi:MAG: hypothetical protein ACRYGK_10435 [Janthinobacterium lividum]
MLKIVAAKNVKIEIDRRVPPIHKAVERQTFRKFLQAIFTPHYANNDWRFKPSLFIDLSAGLVTDKRFEFPTIEQYFRVPPRGSATPLSMASGIPGTPLAQYK